VSYIPLEPSRLEPARAGAEIPKHRGVTYEHTPFPTKYTVHSEFRTALATGLIQASGRQFLKRKRTSIGPAIERSMIRLDDHQICRRKSPGDCRGCKEIGLTAMPRKRQVLGEITPNLDGSKRGKRSIFGCDICDIPLCKDGPCWAAYHNSL